MSVQNSTDLLQMSLSTLCLNKTKYDPSRAENYIDLSRTVPLSPLPILGICEFEFLNNCFADGKWWKCAFWQRDCLTFIFRMKLPFRANFWFLSFDLAICLVTLIWFDWLNKWSLICLICDQFIDQMIIRSIKIYRLTIFSVLYFWVVNAVNKCFLLRKVHVELALVLC